MATAARTLAFALIFPTLILTLIVPLTAACGDDGEEGGEIQPTTGLGDMPVEDDDCREFCEKTNECARAEGRAIPPEAEDCAQSCAPGGIHRRAPAALHVCAEEACGPAFVECSRRVMIAHMRDQDIPVFPPICSGLCEKSALCHRRASQPLGPGEDDCDAACSPGGAYHGLSDEEILCVHQPCGPPLETCRGEGGPSGPIEVLPPPTAPNQGPPQVSPGNSP